jgi:hypothetical protein
MKNQTDFCKTAHQIGYCDVMTESHSQDYRDLMEERATSEALERRRAQLHIERDNLQSQVEQLQAQLNKANQ